MKCKILRFITFVCAVVFIIPANKLFAQQLATQAAVKLVRNNASSLGLSKTDLQNLRISAAYVDKASGASLVYVQQTYKGVDVFNAIQTYAFKNGTLLSAAGGRIAKMEDKVNIKNAKAAVSASDAVNAAAAHLKLSVSASLSLAKQTSEMQDFDFGKLDISSVDVKSKLIWLADETAKNALLSWQVEIQPNGTSDYWLVNVDAAKGNVINKLNLTINCRWNKPGFRGNVQNNFTITDAADDIAAINTGKYRVVPFPAESPNHPGGAPALKTNPWDLAGAGNDAVTLKWNDNGTTTFDSSRGNNVLAQEDANGNNGFGKGAHSTQPAPDLKFNYKPDFTKEPTVNVNQQFALTNLFYWNNIVHDISYQYGFDESSGNFQANNLSRGGKGNDYVFADGQDGAGTDNANFSTPADGSSPRMQMYLWSAVPSVTVIQPAGFAGKKAAAESAFSTNNKLSNKGPIQNKVVLYADNTNNTKHEACGAAANAAQLNGKIAFIDRGTCNFTVKVKNAQNAGAIAAIVGDNIPGEYPFSMGGTDNSITIPAVMVSFETGDSIKQTLANTSKLVINMSGGVRIDGDLDNGIISHEYTHGISNRLTGGPNNVSCLFNNEQMGEGWSDYMSLMVTTDWANTRLKDSAKPRPIGTYALGQPLNGSGIRYYPYTPNFNANPWTYDSLKLSSRIAGLPDPHTIGEVWCNMLWVMTWALNKQEGINSNIYRASAKGGNNIALQLVMEGMKLQPCSPGFVDGRNAILKADSMLYGAAHSLTIWKAFASRGLGYHASQGSSNNVKDGIADYSLPPSPIAQHAQTQNAAAKFLGSILLSPNPAGNNVTLTIGGNKKLLTIDLVNTTGQQLKRFTMNSEILQINLPKLASGMYYIKITGEGFSETRKLMIQ